MIRQKLSLMESSLDTLESIGEVTETRLEDENVVAAAVERLVTRVVDLAVDVNSHVASVRLGRHPGEYGESFRMATEAGLLDPSLAEDLIGSVGLRNVIIRQYADLDRSIMAEAVPKTLDGYRRFVGAVARFTTENAS